MYPPPRPSTPIQSSGKARETEPSPEDDLLAITGSGLRPSLSIITPSEAASSPDISPHTLPTASSTRSRSLYAGVRFHDPPSTDDLLRLPQSTSPKPRNPASTPSSLSARPDELIYTMPQYQPVSAGSTNAPRTMSQVSPGFIFNDKDQLIHSLRTHRVNTITELRRIEKIFAHMNSAEVTQPMTAAWAHYVNSNNLLNELRGLTRNYPFSSDLLDEAKRLVVNDPDSVRSWNYCWLVLLKIEKEGLIARHARALATKPTMWGNRAPTAAGVQQLANACVAEWTRAVRQMLRHWDAPPSTTGR